MKRAIKITMVCPIEIDDEVDANDIENAEMDAIKEDLFSTEYLCQWDELRVEDMCEWED